MKEPGSRPPCKIHYPMRAADTLCAGLPALLDSVAASLPHVRPTGLGVVCTARDDRALLVYADAFGSTAYFPRLVELPEAFRPRLAGIRFVSPDDLERNPAGLVESRLMHVGIGVEFTRPPRLEQILTLPVAGSTPSAILVGGFESPRGLSDADLTSLESVGPEVRELCERTESAQEELERLRRLEAVERLLPALFKVLDLREIFDRLSSITKDVITHDFASVGMLNDSLTELSLFAKTSTLGTAEYTGPMPYPPSQTASWLLRFVPDLVQHPLDGKRDHSVREGGRSSIRVAIRLDDRTIGALNFTSRQLRCYGALDLTIGRRVADYVALAVSHQRLAEEGRRAAAQERNAKLE